MNLPQRYNSTALLDRLAADWLTGGLSPAAQRRAQRLLEQSPAFASAVLRWRERLDAGLLSSKDYGQPADAIWQGIWRCSVRLQALRRRPLSRPAGVRVPGAASLFCLVAWQRRPWRFR